VPENENKVRFYSLSSMVGTFVPGCAAIVSGAASLILTAIMVAFGAFWWALAFVLAGALIVALVLAPVFLLTRHQVSVGVDGIRVRLGMDQRFIPYSEIEQIELLRPKLGEYTLPTSWWRLELKLRTGETVTVRTRYGGTGLRRAHADTPGIRCEQDIHQALEAEQAAAELSENEQLLDVGQAASSQWLESLRALGKADDPYRRRTIDQKRLVEITEDSKMAPSIRAAAAIALEGREGIESRQRLRIAADQYAHRQTRKRLLRISEEDDDERLAQEFEALAELTTDTQEQVSRAN